MIMQEVRDRVEQGQFLEAMSRLAAGVVMVTGRVGGRPWGMTVSACSSISVDPPTLMVALSRHTALATAIRENARFGVCILGARAIDVARFGSAPGAPKFLDDSEHAIFGHELAPGVDGAIAHADCDVVKVVDHGTHTMFLGEVHRLEFDEVTEPLVYFRRGFRQLEADA